MRYEILGPLQLVGNQGVVPIESRKLQVVLATLLICGDQVVSVERLIKEIWGEEPPRRATAGIHVYISHLRRTLSHVSGSGHSIATKPPGYLLVLGGDELDANEFQRFLADGKTAYRQHRYEEAADIFQRALSLWHGPVADEMKSDGPIIRGFTLYLEDMRLECIESMIAATLALGRYRELVGYLYSMISEHPLHESFYQNLMVALYYSGRRADALKVYQTARETFKIELGLEPSRPLRELQQKILVTDDVR